MVANDCGSFWCLRHDIFGMNAYFQIRKTFPKDKSSVNRKIPIEENSHSCATIQKMCHKTCLLTQFFPSPNHKDKNLSKLQNKLIEISKFCCPNFQMYLSKLQNDRTATQFLLSTILIRRDNKTKILHCLLFQSIPKSVIL